MTGRINGGSSRRWAALAAGAISAVLVALLAAAGSGPASASTPVSSPADRYALAGGCFALRSEANGQFVAKGGGGYAASAGAAGGAERFRMQATDLGRYLLYGTARDFLAITLLGVRPAAQPSNNADWTVSEDGGAFRIVNESAGRDLAIGGGGGLTTVPTGSAGAAGRFGFTPTSGCPAYPEVEVNVTGRPSTRSPLYGEVAGLIEGHMHHMAFEFLGGGAHCGRPWHRFGAPAALVDCPDHAATNGCGAVLENVLYGDPARCHDPEGWPGFTDWPAPRSLTHEQSYYRWIERAWRGGLRVYVNLLVENRVLCELYPIKRNPCDEMGSVRLQAKRSFELQRYIDAQSGGPGKGWYRIVRDPFQARRVINQGKLAVILGMEVSEPFGCRLQNDVPLCTPQQVDEGIDELYEMGVRQLELINKFDNALAGVAGDAGETGTITNTGNFLSTGRFWDLEHCDDDLNHDHSPTGLPVHNDDLIVANGLQALLPGGTLPLYPQPPHCNKRGLSQLGERAVRRLAAKGMIFDPDHMSVYARNQALDLVESLNYPGLISSHSWSTDNALPRIYRLGGLVTPYAGDSEGFVRKWQRAKAHHRQHGGDPYFGIGYGADMNGLGAQGDPRGANVPNPVTYPFKSFDGKQTIHRQRSGTRVYDINTDGVAHYGLYPDWVEDLRRLAGEQIVKDLSRGAEAYLRTWERANGVAGPGCRAWPGRFTAAGLGGRLRLGTAPRVALHRAGQPQRRSRGWRWCAQNRRGKRVGGGVNAAFGPRGKLALIASRLPHHRAAGIGPGMRVRRVARRARALGGGLWVRRARGGKRFVYRVRGGKVRYAGVASRAIGKSPRALRRHLRFAGLR